MEIRFELTGAARKELVKAIENITGEKAVYMKMPTRNYTVGDYTITKDGTVINEDSFSLQHLVHLLKEDGFEPVGDYEETEVEADEAEEVEDTETEEIEVDEAEQEATEAENAENDDTDDAEQEDEPDEAEQTDKAEPERNDLDLTVEIPLDKVAVGNLTKLLDAKGNLIKLALGIDSLPIEIKEDRVAFPWFTEVEPDEAMAYTKFILALCRMAKEAKRVTAVEKEIVNPKYEFRCFLLRLGFIGDEYKADRKVLLKNLSGSSAWKSGQKGGSDDELSE